MNENLSHLDLRLLQQIQRDSSLSTSELSEKVGISQSPCSRRRQRLRDERYVRKQVALFASSKFGQSFFIYAPLKIGTLTDDQRADFTTKVEIKPENIHCNSSKENR